MNECIMCGKELEKYKERGNLCDSCFRVITAKYPKNKFQEVIKCHQKNAKKLRKE